VQFTTRKAVLPRGPMANNDRVAAA